MSDKKEDRSTWAIGGTIIMGVGIGLIFIKTSPMLFVASLLVGVGSGLVVTAILSSRKE